MRPRTPSISLACVTAYNDFLVEFAAADPKRFHTRSPWCRSGTRMPPSRRCTGHASPATAAYSVRQQVRDGRSAAFTDPHWDHGSTPTAQDLEPVGELPRRASRRATVERHVVGRPGHATTTRWVRWRWRPTSRSRASTSVTSAARHFRAGAKSKLGLDVEPPHDSIAAIVTSGFVIGSRSLKFVSVESGFGYITYLLESLDWHWKGTARVRSRRCCRASTSGGSATARSGSSG